MGFIVNRSRGTQDGDLETYVRLLRQRGIDLGNLPRVPDPETGRQWLHARDTRQGAEEFADALREEMGDDGWQFPAAVRRGRRPSGIRSWARSWPVPCPWRN